MNNYHNTNGLIGEELQDALNKNMKQEEIILKMFKHFKELTASEAHHFYPNRQVPLTSIRRAISNLTYDNKLEITEKTKVGIYGAKEHYYKLVGYSNVQISLFE
jgi:hypothetical protein